MSPPDRLTRDFVNRDPNFMVSHNFINLKKAFPDFVPNFCLRDLIALNLVLFLEIIDKTLVMSTIRVTSRITKEVSKYLLIALKNPFLSTGAEVIFHTFSAINSGKNHLQLLIFSYSFFHVLSPFL